MAVNLQNQDKLIELLTEIIDGEVDAIKARRQAWRLQGKINDAVILMHESIDFHIASSMPAEFLAYHIMETNARQEDRYYANKDNTFDLDYFKDRYEKTTGENFLDAIDKDDRLNADQKESFKEFLEDNKKVSINECLDVVTRLTDYMSDVDKDIFKTTVEEINENCRLGTPEEKKKVIFNMLDGNVDNPSRFEQIGKEVVGQERFSDEFSRLSENKKGILGFGEKELNDMSFAAVMHEADLEKTKSVQEVAKSLGLDKFYKENERLINITRLGQIVAGNKAYSLVDLVDKPGQLEDQIKTNQQVERILNFAENKKYIKTKQASEEAKRRAEEAALAQKDKEAQLAKKQADNARVEGIITKANDTRTEKFDMFDSAPEIFKGFSGSTLRKDINQGIKNLEVAKEAYDKNDKSYRKFVLMDLDKPENVEAIAKWGKSQSDAKTFNEMKEFLEPIAHVYPDAMKAYDIAIKPYHERRVEKVKDTIYKGLDGMQDVFSNYSEKLLHVAKNTESQELFEETEKFVGRAGRTFLDARALADNLASDKDLIIHNKVTKDNFYAINIYLDSDVDALRNFVSKASKEEMISTIDKLDYIERNNIMGIKYTYAKVHEMVQERPDAADYKFERIEEVKEQIDHSKGKKQEKEYGRERTLE